MREGFPGDGGSALVHARGSSLNRTQSAVSMQMKRLEEQLGVALLRRSKAGVDLTLAGEQFLGDARRLVALNDDAVGRLIEHNLEGHVRHGAMEDYGAALIPPLLASFVAAYPNIRVEMETGLTYAMPDRLGGRSISSSRCTQRARVKASSFAASRLCGRGA